MILYEIWAFIRPGLERKENFVFFFAMVAGLFFFILGAGFAYKIALPFMLYFFIHVNASASIIASISIESYLSFIMTIFITFGTVFEMPVATVILTQLGLMRPEWMVKGRSVVNVVIFIVAAIITPPGRCLADHDRPADAAAVSAEHLAVPGFPQTQNCRQ